jgi:hypothetical protein
LEEKGVEAPDEVLNKYLAATSEKPSEKLQDMYMVDDEPGDFIAIQRIPPTGIKSHGTVGRTKLNLRPISYQETLAVYPPEDTHRRIVRIVEEPPEKYNMSRLLASR